LAVTAALLETEALEVRYGAICALQGVTLSVQPGEIVTLIGSNGAGKSTLLRAISGLLEPASGAIRFEGRDVTRARPDVLVALGISHVPEGRRIFANLSVRENLQMGAYLPPASSASSRCFPV
jgi:branched-chain amino acid transport system ATP-binding protein